MQWLLIGWIPMIDKIQVSSSEFGIGDDAVLTVVPASYDTDNQPKAEAPAGGVLFERAGIYHYGSRAFKNTDTFNLTINPNFGLEVHFNPAVVIHRNNFYPVTESEFHKSINIVQGQLDEAGIHLDMNSAAIVRLDTAQDRELEEPIEAYFQLFRLLQAKRAKPNEQENGYYFSNGNRQIVFYDKLEEMRRRKVMLSPSLNGKNIIRCEYRLRRKDAVRRLAELNGISLNTIADIRKMPFQELERLHRKAISEFAFTSIPAPDSMAFSLKTEIEILAEFRSRFKRNSLSLYHEARTNLERFGSIDNYKKSLAAAGFDRSYIFRHGEKILQCISIIEKVEAQNGKKNIGSLYKEIYDAFIKAAA